MCFSTICQMCCQDQNDYINYKLLFLLFIDINLYILKICLNNLSKYNKIIYFLFLLLLEIVLLFKIIDVMSSLIIKFNKLYNYTKVFAELTINRVGIIIESILL